MNLIKEFFKDYLVKYSGFIKNISFLTILQISNYIYPIIVFPYIVRTLGLANFGLASFANAFVTYFILAVNYGFDLSATREVARFKNDKNKIENIFGDVFFTKLVIFIVITLIFVSIIFLFQVFENKIVFIYCYGLVLGSLLFPLWFYLGIEKMKYITIIQLSTKSISLVLIFLLVNNPDDLLTYLFINSATSILTGLIGLVTIVIIYDFRFKKPSFNRIIIQLHSGWMIFLSNITVSLYTISNTFLLGLYFPSEIVGFYSSAEKIVKAVRALLQPISQAYYPHISELFHNSSLEAIKLNFKMLKILGVLSFLISIGTIIFSSQIIHLILGEKYQESILVLRILGIIIFLITINNLLGINTMLPAGYDKMFTLFLTIGGMVNLILSLVFVPHYSYIASSICVVFTELFVTILMYLFLLNKGLIKTYV